MNAGARRKIRPDLPNRCVEAEARQLGRTIFRRNPEGLLVPYNQIQKIAVRNFHAFRRPRRAGRVNHIGEVIGSHHRFNCI